MGLWACRASQTHEPVMATISKPVMTIRLARIGGRELSQGPARDPFSQFITGFLAIP